MENNKRIYIAGPMTGLPHHNFPAFHAAADLLRRDGWQVFNPAENFGGRTDLSRPTYLRADLSVLIQCNAIAVLPGWIKSRGAKLEYLIARELQLTVLDIQTLKPLRNPPSSMALVYSLYQGDPANESILDEAKGITEGVRQNDYGHPTDDFDRAARMWTGILRGKLRDDAEIAVIDVPLCMIAVKLARESHRHKRDNLVDIAGYARTAAMIAGDE